MPAPRSGTGMLLLSPLLLLFFLKPPPICASSVVLGTGSKTNHLLIFLTPEQTLHYELRHDGNIITGADLVDAVIQATGGFSVTTSPNDTEGVPISFASQLIRWNGQGLFAHFYQYSFGVFINGLAWGSSSAAADGSFTSYFNYQIAGDSGEFSAASVGPTERVLLDGDFDAYVFTGSIPSPGLAAWKTAQDITNLAGDEDGDGLTNLMEYALKRDPHFPDSAGSVQAGRTVINGSLFLTLTYRRLYDAWTTAPDGADAGYEGIAYTVETSEDLVTWKSGTNHVTQFVTPDANGATATVLACVPWGSRGRFLRLRVHLP